MLRRRALGRKIEEICTKAMMRKFAASDSPVPTGPHQAAGGVHINGGNDVLDRPQGVTLAQAPIGMQTNGVNDVTGRPQPETLDQAQAEAPINSGNDVAGRPHAETVAQAQVQISGGEDVADQSETNDSEELEQYVTMDQAAACVNRSKKTLERHLKKGMPKPDVEGGGGRPHEWKWSTLRPWLERTFGKSLPQRFPRHQ
jgi:hypothetical protein